MTDSELLELTTDQLEAMSDAELVAALGPAIANCRPLPGSDEAEKAAKQAEKEAKELAEAEEAGQLELTETTNPDGTVDLNKVTAGGRMVNGVKMGTKKRPRGKKSTTNDKIKDLLDSMKAAGVNTAGLVNSLPTGLGFK